MPEKAPKIGALGVGDWVRVQRPLLGTSEPLRVKERVKTSVILENGERWSLGRISLARAPGRKA